MLLSGFPFSAGKALEDHGHEEPAREGGADARLGLLGDQGVGLVDW
jgi:hypothetical protein